MFRCVSRGPRRRKRFSPQSCDLIGGHSRTVSVRLVPSGAFVRLVPVLFVCDSILE